MSKAKYINNTKIIKLMRVKFHGLVHFVIETNIIKSLHPQSNS